MTATPAENSSPGTLRIFPVLPLEEYRRRDRERHRVFRARRRTRQSGGVICELHLSGTILHGLRRMGLVAEDERDPETIAAAVCYFLQSTVYELGSILQRFTLNDEQ
jgi:hypothetical protein